MIIPVKYFDKSYDIVLENGALNKADEFFELDRNVLIVTDDGVPEKYINTLRDKCLNPFVFTFPQGEKSKNFDTFRDILSVMVRNGFTRKDCIVAVGGGVAGDMSGFAASCYMRGIDFYNIPTTLLSQIDSSVGGKTAIDFEGVKNTVGAFYPPKKVLIDSDVLKTLDKRQLNAGLAEAIKMALNFDEELFCLIENSENIFEDLTGIIEKSIKIKRDVVEKDPHETGLRKVLNFGHTIGHGIESLSNGKLLHGECVAIGMIPLCGDEIKERVKKVLLKYSLPVNIEYGKAELLPLLSLDKKMNNGKIDTVICNKIGSFEILPMTAEELLNRCNIR